MSTKDNAVLYNIQDTPSLFINSSNPWGKVSKGEHNSSMDTGNQLWTIPLKREIIREGYTAFK